MFASTKVFTGEVQSLCRKNKNEDVEEYILYTGGQSSASRRAYIIEDTFA
jgi:hypothetical protein